MNGLHLRCTRWMGGAEEPATVRVVPTAFARRKIVTTVTNRIYVPCRAAQPVALAKLQLYSFPPDDAAPVTEDEGQTAVLECRHGE